MEFSSSSIYSMISTKGNEDSIENVLKLIEELNQIDDVQCVKQYLYDNYHIEDMVQNFPICTDGFMNIVENSSMLIINILYSYRNITYSYLK